MSDDTREFPPPGPGPWAGTIPPSERRARERDAAPVIPVESEDDQYCHACGEYMPMRLDGSERVHGCERTPPLDGLPPNIYVCPTCGGHARSRYGCWGTEAHPHPHAFMQPLHEIVPQGTGQERVVPAPTFGCPFCGRIEDHEFECKHGGSIPLAKAERVIAATDLRYEWRVCIGHVPSQPASWSSGPITSREAAEEALQRALAAHPDDYGWIQCRVAPGSWLDEYTAKTPSGGTT